MSGAATPISLLVVVEIEAIIRVFDVGAVAFVLTTQLLQAGLVLVGVVRDPAVDKTGLV